MLKKLRNAFLNRNRYREASGAVIIACYFNPQKSPYRKSARVLGWY